MQALSKEQQIEQALHGCQFVLAPFAVYYDESTDSYSYTEFFNTEGELFDAEFRDKVIHDLFKDKIHWFLEPEKPQPKAEVKKTSPPPKKNPPPQKGKDNNNKKGKGGAPSAVRPKKSQKH